MKQIVIGGLIAIALITYIVIKKSASQTISAAPTSISQSVDNLPGSFKDGSYTGQVADAFYGNLQVKAVITNGKISDVQFLQYPNDQDESRQINRQAMPLLKSEAITTQHADVDIVSGATQSSLAFRETLQSALDQAK